MSGSSRDSSELRDIYVRYASIVHARCRSILKSEDDAWDATQEVFIKLQKALPQVRNKGSIYYWLMSASTNHCISQLRKRKLEEFDEAIHSSSQKSGVPPQERKLAMKELLGRYLLPWDKKVREVIYYTYIDGYKQEEIAKLTGLGESTVRKYLTRFRRANAEAASKEEAV